MDGNAEDPAYPIMRKAIAKREYYRNRLPDYKTQVYIKGRVELENVPEKIFGQEVGDLDGALDSTRSGIVYLSESVSELYYRADPRKTREVMISSKVSGNDRGFSFNSARDMNFSLYDPRLDFNRPVPSPLADGAFGVYRFRLEGTFYDEDGRLINKIEVSPRNVEAPSYRGFIYIVEDLWNLQSVDLTLLGKALHIPGFDTLIWQQTYVPIDSTDGWAVFQNRFIPKGGLFGLRFGGNFVGIYRNYELNPELAADFFDTPESLRVEADANQRDTSYWNLIRPLALTQSERVDYQRKDSIQVVRESPAYLDSIDRVVNRVKPLELLSGMTFQNSQKFNRISVDGLLSSVQFNTVQGLSLGTNVRFTAGNDRDFTTYSRFDVKARYGFGDERFRLELEGFRLLNRIHYTGFGFALGQRVSDLNTGSPIESELITSYALFGRRNEVKLFQQSFLTGYFQRELVNGLFLRTRLSYRVHDALSNRSDFSFKKADEDDFYTSNHPLLPTIPGERLFEQYRQLYLDINMRIRFNQRYTSYPDRRFYQNSKLPQLFLRARYAAPLGDDWADYLRVAAEVRETNLSVGRLGFLDFSLEAGIFLRNERLELPDYFHFAGNVYSVVSSENNLQRQFLELPLYDFSTPDRYFEGHVQHHFQGFLLDKIPLIKKLRFQTVVSARYLRVPEPVGDYWELAVGLENVGFGAIRPFRVDWVFPFLAGDFTASSVVLSLPLGGA